MGHVAIRRFFFVLSCLPFATSGQSNFYSPSFFTAYFHQFSQITPAYIPKETHAEFLCGYKSMTGAFRKVSSFYGAASKSFENSKGQVHLVRLQFYNEKEGSYISSPRAYANYAFQLPLREELFAYAGVALGAVSVYYSAPTTTQSSYTLPDGSIGLGLKSSWFDVGASSMQLFNASYAPLQSTTTLQRFYHAYGTLQKQWPSEWGVRGRLLWRNLPAWSDEIVGSGSFFYSDRLEFGLNASQFTGLSVFTLLGMASDRDNLKLLLNYNSSFFALVPAWQNSLEVGLTYAIK